MNEYRPYTKTSKRWKNNMAIKKNNYSTCKVINSKGQVVGYLCSKDENNGLDIQLDSQGYTIIAL